MGKKLVKYRKIKKWSRINFRVSTSQIGWGKFATNQKN